MFAASSFFTQDCARPPHGKNDSLARSDCMFDLGLYSVLVNFVFIQPISCFVMDLSKIGFGILTVGGTEERRNLQWTSSQL